jgi:diketogulonate reductase-like aldo/keto reductase
MLGTAGETPTAEGVQMRLNDGTDLPEIGFGTYPLRGQEAVDAVAGAIGLGYRLIDTAMNYGNEEAVARGIDASGIDRDELVLTTKLPGRHHGYDETMRSFETSCAALGCEVLDLYLIHWPNPSVGKYVDSWRAMVQLQRDGRIRSVGVSNFTPEHLTRIADETGVLPAVNQIEMHPYFPQVEQRAFHAQHGIVTEAWSPLGKRNAPYDQEPVRAAAERHGVTPAQVILRWHTQLGSVPIPKSGNPQRQRENLDVFGFELDADELDAVTALGRPDGRLFGGDPNTHEEM